MVVDGGGQRGLGGGQRDLGCFAAPDHLLERALGDLHVAEHGQLAVAVEPQHPIIGAVGALEQLDGDGTQQGDHTTMVGLGAVADDQCLAFGLDGQRQLVGHRPELADDGVVGLDHAVELGDREHERRDRLGVVARVRHPQRAGEVAEPRRRSPRGPVARIVEQILERAAITGEHDRIGDVVECRVVLRRGGSGCDREHQERGEDAPRTGEGGAKGGA